MIRTRAVMLLPGARIYPFPSPCDAGHWLTVRDRLDLHEWGGRIEAAGFRCIVGRDRTGVTHDFIQLHRLTDPDAGAAWTLVREGVAVRAWRGARGADLGRFPALADAIAAVLTAGPVAPKPPGRRTRVRHRPRAPAAHPVLRPGH